MKTASLVFPLLVGVCLGGCGGDSDGKLSGSAESTYDLRYDRIEIMRQEVGGKFDAMIVRYVRGPNPNPEVPVKVVAKAPIEEGVRKDISGDGGSLSRVMADASSFPDLSAGTIVFDSLGGVGENASGKFNVTFVESSGRKDTLNGDFDGTVQLLSL